MEDTFVLCFIYYTLLSSLFLVAVPLQIIIQFYLVDFGFHVIYMCLAKGRKDNITALILKMKEQKVGYGGCIIPRRK